jgi:hypothetical protein
MFVEREVVLYREKSILPIFCVVCDEGLSLVFSRSRPIIIHHHYVSLILCSGRTTNALNDETEQEAENNLDRNLYDIAGHSPLGEVCEVWMSNCRRAHIRLSFLWGKLAIYGFDENILFKEVCEVLNILYCISRCDTSNIFNIIHTISIVLKQQSIYLCVPII